jgi:hypothetical protein
MKLVAKTKNNHFYMVRLPNYFDLSEAPEVLGVMAKKIPAGETFVEHIFYTDAMPTMEERKQYDCYGKITDSPIELQLS